MRFDVVTLFPEIFDGFVSESLLKLAIERGLVEVHRWNLRDWSSNRHDKVDDRPYGGGPGMVIMPAPVFDCVEAVQSKAPRPGQLVLLSPQGRRLDQELVHELARLDRLVLLCGRYEGFDERVRIGLGPLDISIGDFVCNGGEVPAMLLIESVSRLLPGVLGDSASAKEDSFSRPGWLEYAQYTRPPVYRGMAVPEVLLSGDHRRIARWRAEQAERRSLSRKQPKGAPHVDSTSPGQS